MNFKSIRIFVSVVIVAGAASTLSAATINSEERELQSSAYERWWGRDLVWKFDDLPKAGLVEKFRMPYAGAIYPDSKGGTEQVLRKYDRAFYGGRSLAVSFERRDIEIHQQPEKRGLFKLRTKLDTPDWAGHCNGWTAAAIRHAEPENNVVRNGYTFTPADIKGLLAELYTFCDIEYLGGLDAAINPATLHVVLANWLGRGQHPIGMDKTVGEEVWNYPIYGYTSDSAKRGSRRVEVKTNIGYVKYTNQEYNVGPDNHRFLYLHYMLDLNARGEVTGGYYFNDSNQIDMLWAPLQPTPGGSPTNDLGNPYLDVKTVLGMWRESAPEAKRNKWYNIDPTDEDRVLVDEETATTADDDATDDLEPEPMDLDYWNLSDREDDE